MPHEFQDAPAPSRYFLKQAWAEHQRRMDDAIDDVTD